MIDTAIVDKGWQWPRIYYLCKKQKSTVLSRIVHEWEEQVHASSKNLEVEKFHFSEISVCPLNFNIYTYIFGSGLLGISIYVNFWWHWNFLSISGDLCGFKYKRTAEIQVAKIVCTEKVSYICIQYSNCNSCWINHWDESSAKFHSNLRS